MCAGTEPKCMIKNYGSVTDTAGHHRDQTVPLLFSNGYPLREHLADDNTE